MKKFDKGKYHFIRSRDDIPLLPQKKPAQQPPTEPPPAAGPKPPEPTVKPTPEKRPLRRRFATSSSVIRTRLGFGRPAPGKPGTKSTDSKSRLGVVRPHANGQDASRRHSIPGFAIMSKLGSGGTSAVFLAQDLYHNERKVALKILSPRKAAIPSEMTKFLAESEMLIRFRHPNLVKGFKTGQYKGLHYLVLEYLHGKTVQTMLEERGSLPEEEALDIILQIGDALAYIESQGILHRDIKPGNIVVLKDGTAKLCDLGYAQKIKSSETETVDETTSGTVHYMSPEQAMGKGNIDIRSDIYSLGATLYHMVMGELPFSGTDNMEVMAKQVLDALNSPHIKNKGRSRHMHYFIERMMAKEINLRYTTPKELRDDIEEHLKGFYSSLSHRPGMP